jgi:carbon storage regulator
MLILSRKTNEKIMIGDEISLTIIEIRGDQVKIGIEAPKSVKVFRQEVFEAIQNENRAAAVSGANLETLSGIITAQD